VVLAEIANVDDRFAARGAFDFEVVRVDVIDVHEPCSATPAMGLELVAVH